jgi:hypothetical protein
MLDDLVRLQIFDLDTREYREPDKSDTMIPPEPWQPPQPPPGAAQAEEKRKAEEEEEAKVLREP